MRKYITVVSGIFALLCIIAGIYLLISSSKVLMHDIVFPLLWICALVSLAFFILRIKGVKIPCGISIAAGIVFTLLLAVYITLFSLHLNKLISDKTSRDETKKVIEGIYK